MQRARICLMIATAVMVVSAGVASGAQANPPSKPASKPAEPAKPSVLTIPTAYDQDRFFALPITESGVALKFLISTGGHSIIYSDAVASISVPITRELGKTTTVLPAFDPEHSIPTPRGNRGIIPLVSSRYHRPYLPGDCSGVLGETWFADRVWTIDYPAKKIVLRRIGDLPSVEKSHIVQIGFRTSGLRSRDNNLPRIDIHVGGKRLVVLLDTGASAVLDSKALEALGDKGSPARAMSFVSQSQLDAWQKEHKWRVILSGEQGSDAAMIEVPKIKLGGYEVGPVWFMARRDAYFSNQVSRKLDVRVSGILGGSALKFFRVTLDFPGSAMLVERP